MLFYLAQAPSGGGGFNVLQSLQSAFRPDVGADSTAGGSGGCSSTRGYATRQRVGAGGPDAEQVSGSDALEQPADPRRSIGRIRELLLHAGVTFRSRGGPNRRTG